MDDAFFAFNVPMSGRIMNATTRSTGYHRMAEAKARGLHHRCRHGHRAQPLIVYIEHSLHTSSTQCLVG